MNRKPARVLVIGYGNPGRLDDGLGPAAAAALESEDLPGVTVDVDYQLTVEHASEVAAHDVAILVDASVSGREPFSFERVEAGSATSFSTHSVEPSGLVALARDLFDAKAETWILGIRGYEFNEFGERLSPRATRNLDAALDFLRTVIPRRDFDAAEAEIRAQEAGADAPAGDGRCVTART